MENENLDSQLVKAILPIVEKAFKLALDNVAPPAPPERDLLTADEAAELLGVKLSSLYVMHHHKEIPGVYKRGKRLQFSKKILENWIKESGK